MNLEEASMTESLTRAGGGLRHVHWVDSNRRAAGMGHLDFPSLLGVLESLGYDGYLSAECLPLPDDDTAARAWLGNTRRWLAEAKPETLHVTFPV
jgi:sugar phosphate isomerase/epimerase